MSDAPTPADALSPDEDATHAELNREAIEDHRRLAEGIPRHESLAHNDLIPNPTNIGGLRRGLIQIEELKEINKATPGVWEVNARLARRWSAIERTPVYRELERYINVELGMEVCPDAMRMVEARLAKLLNATFLEVRFLSLADAVAALVPPTLASPPTPVAPPAAAPENPGPTVEEAGDQEAESKVPPPAPVEPAAAAGEIPGRPGRRKDQDKISEAIAALTTRLKEGKPYGIPKIARDVGCSPQNLRASGRFMNAYTVMTNAFSDAVRGTKNDGQMEAWDEGPDEEQDDE